MPSKSGINSTVAASLLAVFTLCPSVEGKAPAGNAKTPALVKSKDGTASIDANKVSTTENKPSNINMKALHRLDFRVVGKSCAICLMKIQKRLNATPGVVKVAVMLKKPYGAVVIYDSTKVTKEQLLVVAKGDEKGITFEDIVDEPIQRIPLILIPKNCLDKGADTAEPAGH